MKGSEKEKQTNEIKIAILLLASLDTQDRPNHGREEIRKIWVTTELNENLNFPHVGQALKVEQIVRDSDKLFRGHDDSALYVDETGILKKGKIPEDPIVFKTKYQ